MKKQLYNDVFYNEIFVFYNGGGVAVDALTEPSFAPARRAVPVAESEGEERARCVGPCGPTAPGTR